MPPPRPAKPIVVVAKVLIEPGAESPERTTAYVVQALKSACRNIRDGSVVIAVYDEDEDVLLGLDLSGAPTADFTKQVEHLFESAPGQVELG